MMRTPFYVDPDEQFSRDQALLSALRQYDSYDPSCDGCGRAASTCKQEPCPHRREEATDETGGYYVSVVDGPRYGLLLGPFNAHQDALARVDEVREWVTERSAPAHWYGFGTCRIKDESKRKPGRLNDQLGVPS